MKIRNGEDLLYVFSINQPKDGLISESTPISKTKYVLTTKHPTAIRHPSVTRHHTMILPLSYRYEP